MHKRQNENYNLEKALRNSSNVFENFTWQNTDAANGLSLLQSYCSKHK